MAVVKVPPRRRRVYHKGMYGWIEYHPRDKSWSYIVKFQVTHTHEGEVSTEHEAVYRVKSMIDILIGDGSSVIRSIE